MRTSLLISVLLLVAACSKKNPVISPIPEIRLQEVAPTSLQQFQEQVTIQLAYTDGDGDLGFEHPDSLSLRVQDARLSQPDWYFVQPLAPVGSNVAIQGVLNFAISGTFLLGNGNQETTTFSIMIKDRAGNWSNEVTTPVITIKR